MRRVVRWRNALVATATAVVAAGASMLYLTGSGFNQPTNSVAPAISGLTQVGRSLDCSTGTWGPSGDPPTSYNILWENSPDGSAWAQVGTGSPYAVAATDEGDLLRCRVAAANPNGTVSANSTSTNPVSANDPTIITSDAFTDPDDTTLDAHVGESGADWTQHPSFADAGTLTGGFARGAGGTSVVDYYASGVPADADYDVTANLRWVTTVTNDSTGIWGRRATAANTGYRVVWFQGVGPHGWELSKWVAGTKTSLGSYSEDPANGSTRTVKLEMRGTAIKVYIDGVERISVTDGAVTAAGRAGVRLSRSTATAGVHIDSVYANLPAPSVPTVACANGLDDDSDTFTDFPADVGCANALDDDETNTPACSNAGDDDGDTLIDYPADPGCSSAADNDEFNDPPPPPPVSDVANVWVHALSTGSCARFVAAAEYDAALACPDTGTGGAVGAGYGVVVSNDKLLAKNGTYTDTQMLGYRAGITGVTISPAGGKVTFASRFCLGRRSGTACGTVTTRAPSDLAINADGGSGDFVYQTAVEVTTFGDSTRAERLTWTGGHAQVFFGAQMSNSVVDGMEVGPSFNQETGIGGGFGANVVAENMTYRNLWVHDHQNECRYYEADTVDGIGVLPEVCPDTTLALSASPGATTLTLTDAEGWGCAGCITEGSGRYEEFVLEGRESKRVTAVNGNVLTIASPITGTYAAGTRIWAGNSTHVDNIDIRGMMGTLLIEKTRVYNCGSQCIFLGDAPNGTFAGSTCAIVTVACFEDVIVRDTMVDACEDCGPASALNIKKAEFDPQWTPTGSSLTVEHVSTTAGLNSFQGLSDTPAYSVRTSTFRNNIGKWAGSCTFALANGTDSITHDNNAYQHTDAVGPCSVDEDTITSVEAEFVSANDTTAPFTPDLSLAPGADSIDCGDPVTFSLTDLFGATRPLGAAPDCGAHEKS